MFSIDLLKWLGDRRDGLLVVIAAVYGLGYLVWSYTAWLNGLGQLPALEFQYLVAGLIPGVIIAVAVIVATYLPKLQEILGAYTHRSTLSTVIICLLILLLVYALLDVTFLSIRRFSYIDHNWLPILPSIPKTVLLASLFCSPAVMFLENRVPRGILWLIYRLLIALMVATLSFSFFIEIYHDLPQAMGGPAPRCAYIDVVRSEMSSSSFSALSSTPSGRNHDEQAIDTITSVRVFVYFSGSDYILVRTAADSTNSTELKGAPLYELRRETTRVIHWCADRDISR